MAIREYECLQCGEVKERIEYSGKVYGKMMCEKCDVKMELKVGLGNFILKGNGWYKTDSQ